MSYHEGTAGKLYMTGQTPGWQPASWPGSKSPGGWGWKGRPHSLNVTIVLARLGQTNQECRSPVNKLIVRRTFHIICHKPRVHSDDLSPVCLFVLLVWRSPPLFLLGPSLARARQQPPLLLSVQGALSPGARRPHRPGLECCERKLKKAAFGRQFPGDGVEIDLISGGTDTGMACG